MVVCLVFVEPEMEMEERLLRVPTLVGLLLLSLTIEMHFYFHLSAKHMMVY